MTNDERKTLEDRILLYGDAKAADYAGYDLGADRCWDRVMDELTKIQFKEEKKV